MIPDKNDLLKYINDRKSASEKYEVSEKTIVNWMKKYGIYEPKPNYGSNKLDSEAAVEIRKLFNSGVEIKDIAEKYGVTFSSISRIVTNKTYVEKKDFADVFVIYNINN